MPSDSLLTTIEVAPILRKSPRTVQRMAESGELPYIRRLPGTKGYLFDRAVVEMYARQAAKAAAS
jgi:excisionase family DNA binding protein